MNTYVTEFAKARVRGFERLRLTKYTDTTGNATIGWGHKILKGETIADTIDSFAAERLLTLDFNKAVVDARNHPYWSDALAVGRQAALIDLAYNMGGDWWRTFTVTTEHMRRGEWQQAGDSLLQSRYAAQVHQRANDNAAMIRTGEFVWT